VRRPLAVVAGLLVVVVALLAYCWPEPARQPGAKRWSPAAGPDPSEPRWSDRIAVDRKTGKLSAPGFNALVDSAAPGWSRAPDTTAAELLDLDQPFDGPVEIYLLQQIDGDEAVVTATLTRLGDDSVSAVRYRVVLKKGTDGRHRFVSGTRTWQCRPERGHRDFDTGVCG
jgi:hypothetical protein